MRSVMLFDGDCAFCTTTARWLERAIPAEVELVPWQFADLTGLGVSAERAQREVVWVGIDGGTAGGAQAIARYLGVAGGLWRPLGWLLRMPPIRWLAAGTYRVIANNRHRLPGGTPACALRPPSHAGTAHHGTAHADNARADTARDSVARDGTDPGGPPAGRER